MLLKIHLYLPAHDEAVRVQDMDRGRRSVRLTRNISRLPVVIHERTDEALHSTPSRWVLRVEHERSSFFDRAGITPREGKRSHDDRGTPKHISVLIF